MGESEKQINLPQPIYSESLRDIRSTLRRNSQSLTSLISDFYSILTRMEEQNKSEINVTEHNIEEWLEILEEVERENQTMRTKLKEYKD